MSEDRNKTNTQANGEGDGLVPSQAPSAAFASIEATAQTNGGEYRPPTEYAGSFGRTLFDSQSSEDGLITVVMPPDEVEHVTTQALVRIHSYPDNRIFVGAVSEGPFYDPDGLRADSPTMIVSAVSGAIVMPRHHGRIGVSIIGLEHNRRIGPANRRPRPNSPVFMVPDDEMSRILGLRGDFGIGVVVGHEKVEVPVPVHDKSVLYRHTGILGTTGGGKSTTVTNYVGGLRDNGAAVVLLDTEGEYTTINEPTDNDVMIELLRERGIEHREMLDTHVYYLAGREPSNPAHPSLTPVTLSFEALSPYALIEILDMNDAQQSRLLAAYDLAKRLLRDYGLFPTRGNAQEEQQVLDYDEQEEGYPRLTLQFLIDVVTACICSLQNLPQPSNILTRNVFVQNWNAIKTTVDNSNLEKSPASWKKVSGMLWRLHRLGIFDNHRAQRLDVPTMLQAGRVNIIDLYDLDSPLLRNLAIAQVLRQIHNAQDQHYVDAMAAGRRPTPVNVIIEEAHEFLSSARIRQMPILYQQLAKIAKRGRKRWLGLTFVTQLPQNLPDEVLALINSWILHKIQDESVVNRLRKTIPSIDPSLWRMIAGLRAGQAVVQFSHMSRPMLTAINPSPFRLRLEN